MSINKYNSQTGDLVNLASGSRMWIGSKQAHDNAKQAGTLPNNCLIAITDDSEDNNYSTDEKLTGKYWIDGKPIYRKVIDFGPLPNTTTKGVAHGISNLSQIITLYGISYSPMNSSWYTVPAANSVSTYCFALWCDRTNVSVKTGDDRTYQTPTYIILEYTKTTD